MLNQHGKAKTAPKPVIRLPRAMEVDAPASSPAKADESTLYEAMDRIAHAGVAKATSGLSEAWMDWAVHLAMSPGKQLQLLKPALRNGQSLRAAFLRIGPVPDTADSPPDRRSAGDGWQRYPFDVWWEQGRAGTRPCAMRPAPT